MGQYKPHRKTSLPGVLAEGETHFVSTGGGTSYVQYVINNSGQAIPPATLAHSHAISDVTGLQAALDGKATASGTAGTVAQFTGAAALGNSILTISGVRVSAAGEFVSDMPSETSITRGIILRTSGKTRFSIGKFGADPDNGTNTGSNFEIWRYSDSGSLLGVAFQIVRSTGNATFSGTITASGGNSTTWNAAVPGSRTITINGTTFDLTANRSWTVAGVGGSGTNGFVTKWNGSNLADSSIDDSDANFINTPKGANFGQGGSRWYFSLYPSTSGAVMYWNDPTGSAGYVAQADAGGLHFVGLSAGYFMSMLPSQNVEIYKQLKLSISTGTAPFQIFSTTMSTNLNADMVDGLHASSFALASSLSSYVPISRTLTINGTTFDLSANRSWTISGGVAGTGTANRFAVWVDGVTVAASNLFYNGGNVGVGMNPGYQFDVSGSIRYSVQLASSVATGTAPMTITSTTRVDNLNADMVDGVHASSFVQTSRTLTINGVTYDLSANRSWTISAGGSYTDGNGIGLTGTTFYVNAGTGLWQEADGLSLDVNYLDGRYIRGAGNGLSFRVAVWNATDGITASSIMSDTGTQITISGHLVVNSGTIVLPNLSSDPGSPSSGAIYFSTAANRPRYYNGSSWVTI